MESAYLVLLSTFGCALIMGPMTQNNWIARGLPLLIPVLFLASRLNRPAIGMTLLVTSPFLLASAAVVYALSYAGSKSGRKLWSMLANWRKGNP